jgi:hypothetical protein
MKIKDLPENTNLSKIKVKTPDGVIGYWKSQWEKGVWLQRESDIESGRIIPISIKDLKETLEWEVINKIQ